MIPPPLHHHHDADCYKAYDMRKSTDAIKAAAAYAWPQPITANQRILAYAQSAPAQWATSVYGSPRIGPITPARIDITDPNVRPDLIKSDPRLRNTEIPIEDIPISARDDYEALEGIPTKQVILQGYRCYEVKNIYPASIIRSGRLVDYDKVRLLEQAGFEIPVESQRICGAKGVAWESTELVAECLASHSDTTDWNDDWGDQASDNDAHNRLLWHLSNGGKCSATPGCGIYVAKTLDWLATRGEISRYTILAEVTVFGYVMEYTHGYRAEKVRIEALWCVTPLSQARDIITPNPELLRAFYNVPVYPEHPVWTELVNNRNGRRY